MAAHCKKTIGDKRTGKFSPGIRLLACLITYGLLNGCALTGSNFPSSNNWLDAAKVAAQDKYTWVPLLGAAAVSIDSDWDKQISNWARDNNPVFGSSSTARNVSNGLIYGVALPAAAYSSFANARGNSSICPANEHKSTNEKEDADKVPCEDKTGFSNRYRNVSYDLAAISAAVGVTTVAKEAFGRTRPNGESDDSFPSGHATSAFSAAYLFRTNMTEMHPDQQLVWNIGSAVTATTIAWARVEAGKHYPRDILVGAAIGNFMTSWVHNAYSKKGSPDHVVQNLKIIPDVRRDGLVMNVSWSM